MKRSFNVNFRLLCRKKVCLERLGPKSQPFSDENITISYIIVVIVVMSEANKLKTATTKSQQRDTATMGRFKTKECSKGKLQSCRF